MDLVNIDFFTVRCSLKKCHSRQTKLTIALSPVACVAERAATALGQFSRTIKGVFAADVGKTRCIHTHIDFCFAVRSSEAFGTQTLHEVYIDSSKIFYLKK